MGYADVVLKDNPSGYWRLNEAGGTTAQDASGNNHPGSYVGTVAYSQPAVINEPTTSIGFNGSTTTVTSSAVAQGATNNSYSIEGWALFTGAPPGTAVSIASQEAASGVESTIYWTGTAFEFQHGAPSSFIHATYTFTPVVGTAYHLVGVYDGVNAKLYVNGVLVATTAASTSNAGVTGTRIGSFSNSGGIDFWPGRISDVAVYNSALTAAQIANHYLAGIASYARGLTYDKVILADGPGGYWPLTEAASPFRDLSGNGYDLSQGGDTPYQIATSPIIGAPTGEKVSSWAGTSGSATTSSSVLGYAPPFTLEAWVNPTDFATFRGILDKASGGSPAPYDWYLMQTSGLPDLVAGGTATAAPAAGAWSHLAVTVTAGNAITHYLNGAPNGTATFTPSANGTGSVMIAARPDGGTRWKGGLAHCAVYPVALSAAQIKAHYLSGIVNRNRPAPSTSLVLG